MSATMSRIIPRNVRYISYSRYTWNNTGNLVVFWWVSPLWFWVLCSVFKHHIVAVYIPYTKNVDHIHRNYDIVCTIVVYKWGHFIWGHLTFDFFLHCKKILQNIHGSQRSLPIIFTTLCYIVGVRCWGVSIKRGSTVLMCNIKNSFHL